MTDDSKYSDRDVARLYDVLNPWGASERFYLDLVMGAGAVLDVGCGTGSILKRARSEGHAGRLAGVDPDVAMLGVAREGADIAWHEGRASGMPWAGEFDLAIMSGNAFQCLITDEEIAASLAAIHRALVPGGTFAFDTRNPLAKAWLEWDQAMPMHVVDTRGRELAISYDVLDVTDGVVTLTENTSTRDGTPIRVDRGQLRFVDQEALDGFLREAGFVIAAQFGNWDRTPATPSSTFTVTLAHRA
ncbi:MAG: class I SAM-dependent methyltransferase [Chloroflexota bacterium]|nr:class I SAM-dependent methyltransferase [Chloroflexota bacterium]